MKHKNTQKLTLAAMTAAAYAALSLLGAVFGLTFGPIQVRFSEALCLLPFLFPETAWGLGVGCLIANLFSPYGALDIVVGSLSTLIAALLTARCRSPWTAALPPVVCNMVLVGAVLAYETAGTSAAFWPAYGLNALTVGLGEAVACLVLGVLLAVAAGRLRVLELLLWPYVTAIKSVPVASFIIICLIWMSTRQLAVFISFLMVFPVIYSNTLQGIKSADGALLEMARVYRVPFSRRLGYIYAPQVKPFLLSGCSVALGMSWKSGVAAEVIGVVGGSIGERLYEAKVYFQMTDLLAWTVVIVVCSVGFEKLVLWLLVRVVGGTLPLFRTVNHGAGLCLGALGGVVMIALLCLGLRSFAPEGVGGFFAQEALAESKVASFVYQIFPQG